MDAPKTDRATDAVALTAWFVVFAITILPNEISWLIGMVATYVMLQYATWFELSRHAAKRRARRENR